MNTLNNIMNDDMADDDHFHDKCGVFGIFRQPEAVNLTYLGMYSLQHRGQESSGMVSCDGHNFHSHRGMGLVQDVCSESAIKRLSIGHASIGHVRYSTSGDSELRNCQPFTFEYRYGGISICHNGNIVNASRLRIALENQGAIFRSTSDTEVLIHLLARCSGESTEERLMEAAPKLSGAFSLLLLTETRLIGIRDRHGIRPLVLGKLDNSWVLSSETCAFDLIGATTIRDVQPGEMIIIDKDGIRSLFPFSNPAPASRFCVFEYIYFARPDSTLEGINVYQARYRIGCELAKEAPVEADMIVPVPDSGVPPAMGFAEVVGLPLQMGLIRNHYVGRTFIEPENKIRHFGVRLKLNPNRDLIAGKRIVLVDDSIVRGTTSRKIVEMVRRAGAAEIHVRISSPPTKFSCYYGIDTPDTSKLMANQMKIEAMRQAIGADSLAFVSFDGLYKAIGKPRTKHCDACFSGEYIEDPSEAINSKQQSLLRFFESKS
ncbi:MAG: amidophosphoribosyltransferase [Mariprofundales bacterium]